MYKGISIDMLKQYLLEASNKRQFNTLKITSNREYNDIMLKKIPNIIQNYILADDLILKPSVGQTNYADIPWICILSKNRLISSSVQKGIYIGILFNKKNTGLYLTLTQGYTNFANMKLTTPERKQLIQSVVEYFQKELHDTL